MSKQVIATVNINIGLDNNNPVLIIHEQEDISELISKLIEQYSLPKKVHAIIMERVQEQLNKTALEAKQEKQLKKCQGRVTEADKSLLPMNVPPSPLKDKKSCSPLNRKDLTPVKLRTPLKTNITKKDLSANKFVQKNNQKENDHSFANGQRLASPIGQARQNVNKILPSSKLNNTMKPKLDQKVQKSSRPLSRTPTKSISKRVQLATRTCDQNVQLLFQHLTRDNPKGIQQLTPHHINLKSLNRTLLCDLQEFFEHISQQEFDHITASYFQRRVCELGYTERLGKQGYFEL